MFSLTCTVKTSYKNLDFLIYPKQVLIYIPSKNILWARCDHKSRLDHSFHDDHGYEKAWWEWSHLWSRLITRWSLLPKMLCLRIVHIGKGEKLLWEPKPSEKPTKLYELSIRFHLRRQFQFILSTDLSRYYARRLNFFTELIPAMSDTVFCTYIVITERNYRHQPVYSLVFPQEAFNT